MRTQKRGMFPKVTRLFVITACALLAGCATMLAPDADTITIKTNPEGAAVYSGANLLGTTPLTHSFKRETFEQTTLTIRMQGYKNEELLLQKTIEKKALYNLVFITTTFGVTSWGIDAGSGSMIKYSPDSYFIDLEQERSASSHARGARSQRLRFVVMNQECIMKDIAAGDGEYLRAYFESRQFVAAIDTYQRFQARVFIQAPLLLSSGDPGVFFDNLEGT